MKMIGERYRKDGVTRRIVDAYVDDGVLWVVLDSRQYIYVYDELDGIGWVLVP